MFLNNNFGEIIIKCDDEDDLAIFILFYDA